MNTTKSLQTSQIRARSRDFACGVLILSIAGIVSKICGVLYKIPLSHLLGSGGMGYFGTAYTVYALLYVFSTAGLPSALSILVAKEVGKDGNAPDRILATALSFFGALGAALSVLTLLFSRRIAHFFGSDLSAPSIAAIAPAIFFSCLSGALRGYFQGKSRMSPTAVSQSLEAIGKFLFGIFACERALKNGYGVPTAAAFAVFGVTFSSFLSAAYLLIAAKKSGFSFSRKKTSEHAARKSPDLLTSILLLSMPITMGAALSGVDGMIDLFVFLRILTKNGFPYEAANAFYGIYTSLALPLYNLPTIFVTPVSSCLLPLIASCSDRRREESLAAQAVSCTFLLACPCAIGLTLFSKPILSLLFRAADVPTGAVFLSLLAPGSLFLCLLGVLNSILQAKKHVWLPVLSMGAGTSAKLLIILTSAKTLTTRTAPLSTALCACVSALCAAICLCRVCKLKIPYLKLGFMPLLCASLCCSAAFFAEKRLPDSAFQNLFLISLTALSYFLLLTLTGALNWSELLSLYKHKKGNKNMRIDKFLKVSRVIKRRTVANEACDNGHISVNGKTVKASYEVKVGDEVEITFGAKTLRVRVLSDKELVGKANASLMYEVISE